MDKNVLYMAKMILLVDIVLGVLLAGLSQLFFKGYGLFILLGLFIAMINFSFNNVLSGIVLYKLKSSAALYIVNFIIRIAIAVGIGYIVFRYNKYNLIAYLIGYTSNLLGIYIYSVFENSRGNL